MRADTPKKKKADNKRPGYGSIVDLEKNKAEDIGLGMGIVVDLKVRVLRVLAWPFCRTSAGRGPATQRPSLSLRTARGLGIFKTPQGGHVYV